MLILTDIHMLKRSPLELATALDYAEAILQTIPVPFLVLRADLRVDLASKAFYKNFQVTPEDTEGRLIYEIGNGQWNIPALRKLLEEIIPQQNPFDGFEVTHDFATIGKRTMVLNARQVHPAEGQPERILLGIQDTTDQQRAERGLEALRGSEARMRLATEATQVGIWQRHVPTGEVRWDAQMFRLYGLEPTAEGVLSYADWMQWVVPDDVPAPERVLKDGTREFRILRQDNKKLCHLESVETIRLDAAGAVEWVVGTNLDITERKRSRAALIKAKEQAEAASRAKDDFLAALSHELRTPLTPVLMTVTALENDSSLPLDVRDQLSMMRRNIELEARLIDDLLDLTRISSGKMQIQRRPTDLHTLLEHTAEILGSDHLSKQVSIGFHLEATAHHALVDPTRAQQVFWNLIKNSVKFTPPGGSILVTSKNASPGQMQISVRDTGVGISAKALPKIFKAFEQGDAGGQHRYGGLGLGLAISAAIMKLHEGTLVAESPGLGKGATFTATFTTVDPPPTHALTQTKEPPAARSLHLLLVEDHEATRTVLARLLTKLGHRIVTAASVTEALTAFKEHHFDGLISDLGLPDGTGINLMIEIQKLRPLPGIALSGYGMDGDLQRSKEAGFCAHLVKPVNFDQLKLLMDQLLNQIPV